MAYTKKELIKKSLIAIETHNLLFIEDIVSYLPCTKGTFYNKKLHELDAIKEALETNKIRTKHRLRNKWFNSNNSAREITLYKLLASDEELKRISAQYFDHTTKGESLNTRPDYSGLTSEEIAQLGALQAKVKLNKAKEDGE